MCWHSRVLNLSDDAVVWNISYGDSDNSSGFEEGERMNRIELSMTILLPLLFVLIIVHAIIFSSIQNGLVS